MAASTAQVKKLLQNIKDSFAGLAGDISGTKSKVIPDYPKTKDIVGVVLSDVQPASWSKLVFPYTFGVVNITGAEVKQFEDFSLPLAPQQLHQTEEFAIAIQPTQGGTTVTHSGNRYKTLSLKGTTGLAPFKGAGGAKLSDGEAIFQPKKLKYRSGYEVFLSFRNWIRAYYEFKRRGGESAKDLRLVFKNFKDGEFLIVECTKFEMDRQAARSFLYDYDLEFKVLSLLFDEELSAKITYEADALAKAAELLAIARGVMLRLQDMMRQIEATFNSVVLGPLRQANLAIKAALALPTVAADIGERIVSNTLSELDALAITVGIKKQQDENKVTGTLDSRIADIELPKNVEEVVSSQGGKFINTFNEGLMAISSSEFPDSTQVALAEEQARVVSLPRTFYEDLLVEIDRFKQNAEDFFGLGDATLDSLFERTSTLSAAPTKIITNDELELLYALNSAKQGVNLLLATNILFKSDLSERLDALTENFGGSVEFASSIAVEQIILREGVSLEKLAQQELGDSSRWGEIAELNELRAPYVTSDLSSVDPHVAKPGDKILVPAPLTVGVSQVPEGGQNVSSEGLSTVEKSFGTDFRLNGGFDLALTAGGDLATISGTDNIAQQVLLKLSYERGEVIHFPELGAGIQPGSKFPPLEQLKNGVVNSLLRDARVERIDDLRLVRDGPELKLEFNLQLKKVDLSVPVTIKV